MSDANQCLLKKEICQNKSVGHKSALLCMPVYCLQCKMHDGGIAFAFIHTLQTNLKHYCTLQNKLGLITEVY